MTDEHLGDDAESYALGFLDERASRAVEAHAAVCGACYDRFATALRTAATLAETLPAAGAAPPRLERRLRAAVVPTRRFGPGVLAAAAVAALAFVGLGANDLALRSHETAVDVALATIAGSHFDHVTATASAGSGVTVKILYARDGAWVFAIATGRDRGSLHLIGTDAAQRATDFGKFEDNGTSASLFVRPSAPMRSISVLDGDRAVAVAELRY